MLGWLGASGCFAGFESTCLNVMCATQDPLQAGLELFIDGQWQPVPPGCCLITFGWCAQIRSNDRSAPRITQMLPCMTGHMWKKPIFPHPCQGVQTNEWT